MKNIIKEVKDEIKADRKANKVQKTYTLGQIVKTILVSLVLMAIGGYITLTVSNAINSTINHEVKAQVKSFTSK